MKPKEPEERSAAFYKRSPEVRPAEPPRTEPSPGPRDGEPPPLPRLDPEAPDEPSSAGLAGPAAGVEDPVATQPGAVVADVVAAAPGAAPAPAMVAEQALGQAFMAVADTPLGETVSHAQEPSNETRFDTHDEQIDGPPRPFWNRTVGEAHFRLLREVVGTPERGRKKGRQPEREPGYRVEVVRRFATDARQHTCRRCGRVFYHAVEYCQVCQRAETQVLVAEMKDCHSGDALVGTTRDRVELSVVATEVGWPARLFVNLTSEPVFVRYRNLLAVVMGVRSGQEEMQAFYSLTWTSDSEPL